MRIALLTHSTNPRGGVVHALALAEALVADGHETVVHAPATRPFFRTPRCGTVVLPATPATSTRPLVEARIGDYLRHFEAPEHRRFDVFHAGDGIGANALATLSERGLIGGFARTVHHVDDFADPALARLQQRGLTTASRHLVVSRMWQETLRLRHAIAADLVGNGVDRTTFTPAPDAGDLALRAALGLRDGPVFLAVGGVEARKNTRAILAAFLEVRALVPDATLVIAGGASLLDHDAYRAAFEADMAAAGDAARRVVLTGPVAQDDMPRLYRIAAALVFPSLSEGFGLVALEAIACGTPVVVPRIAPFTEHLGDDAVVWCDPHRTASIADAMAMTLVPAVRARLAAAAATALAPHRWESVAQRHLPAYRALAREAAHA